MSTKKEFVPTVVSDEEVYRRKGRKATVMLEVLKFAKSNPGKWTAVKQGSLGLRSQATKWSGREEFSDIELTVKKGEDGVYTLYARYTPPTAGKKK